MEALKNCPICNHDKFKSFLSCVDYTVSRETFKIVQCDNCGFRFTNPRPDEKEIGKYYQSEEYISHSDTRRGLVNVLYQIVRNHTINQKVKLINRISLNSEFQAPNLLDIGCGTGEFLNACKESGWQITGIEPSEIARKNAEQKYNIIPLPQEKLFEINEKKFNVITLWHVLEHIYQLDKTIEQIGKILSDDGVLVVAVPNCNSFDAKKYGVYWSAWDLPRHIYHFTKKDIEKKFNKYGIRLKEVIPMKFDSYYVSLLSEKYKNGSTNLLSGFWNGLKSNLMAKENETGFSSQIYILQRNKSN